MTTLPRPYTPTREPAGRAVCVRLGGCLGRAWCDYCGFPMPVRHDARRRLVRLVDRLREVDG